jgi:hypothetical protein
MGGPPASTLAWSVFLHRQLQQNRLVFDLALVGQQKSFAQDERELAVLLDW